VTAAGAVVPARPLAAQAHALRAAAAGGQPSASPGWITADGDLAGHPVHVFTPIGEVP
jgi:hypothetical protein